MQKPPKLPDPHFSKINSPWQEDSHQLPEMMPDGSPWPRISIVTPSYNQGQFIEDTIRSVLLQGYPNLEYIIIDGGSTDGSVEIIKKYESRLSFWISEQDQGQYDAINKGFTHATGEILGWINSSDLYCSWTFNVLASVFNQNQEVQWVTSRFPLRWDISSLPIKMKISKGYCKELFFQNRLDIQQESTFWRRSLWDKAGACLQEKYSHAADFELWARFFTWANLYSLDVPLGGNRIHSQQRYQDQLYSNERTSIVGEFGGNSHKGFIDIARKASIFFRMHEMPYLRFFINKYFGYGLHSIVSFSNDIGTKWTVRTHKQLF